MIFKDTTKKACSLTLAAIATACTLNTVARANEQVTLNYEASSSDVSPKKLVSGCSISIAPVKDARHNKETIGHEFTALMATGASPWATAALQRLRDYGYEVNQDSAASSSIQISPSLIRAYTFHGPMRINGMVAIDVDATLANGSHQALKLRASGSKSNMAGMNSEYVTALNYAINNLIDRAAHELAPLCSGQVKTASADLK